MFARVQSKKPDSTTSKVLFEATCFGSDAIGDLIRKLGAGTSYKAEQLICP